MQDIFFVGAYGKLCEVIQGGESAVFLHESSLGTIYHLFLKQELKAPKNEQAIYRSVTPFRYGGPLILDYKRGKKQALVGEFEEAFREYCLLNGIGSEFVRFHPVLNNGADFTNCYDVRFSRHTVATNLKDHKDPVEREFSGSAKRNIRKALRAGVSYRVITKPRDLDVFQNIYYETLDRKGAAEFNYFSPAYFTTCLKYFRENIVLVEAHYCGEIIAASLSFTWNKLIHIHLSGTLTNYLNLSPAYILRYGLTKWGKENCFDLIHHGGGLTTKEDDSLYQFKKRFGTLRFPFQVANRVWN